MENVAVMAKSARGEMSDWHSKVYKLPEGASVGKRVEWDAISSVIKKRDKHTCQSCGGRLALTVHHIRSREDGGQDLPDNLITLCKYCHDEVEQLGLKDKWQIIDLKRKRKYIKQDHKQDFETGDWHSWVYGGSRRPKK